MNRIHQNIAAAIVTFALIVAAFATAAQPQTARADDGNPLPPTMTATPTPDCLGEGNPDHGLC